MTHIVEQPDDILACDVSPMELTEEQIERVADALLKTFDETPNAIGLAAPQIGLLAPIAVVGIPDREHRFVIINPQIVSSSRQKTAVIEGCLSIPNQDFVVESPVNMTVEWIDINGRPQRRAFSHRSARIMRHEIDHLHGILIQDHGREVNNDG